VGKGVGNGLVWEVESGGEHHGLSGNGCFREKGLGDGEGLSALSEVDEFFINAFYAE
jgi:hypothetical protein